MKIFFSLLLGTTLVGSAFANCSIENCKCGVDCNCCEKVHCGCMSASTNNENENNFDAAQTFAACGKCGNKNCRCR